MVACMHGACNAVLFHIHVVHRIWPGALVASDFSMKIVQCIVHSYEQCTCDWGILMTAPGDLDEHSCWITHLRRDVL
jgi:hypothetical protein